MAKKINKSCVISLRLTAAQYSPFVDQIACAGLKPSAYFRSLVLSRAPTLERSPFEKGRMLMAFEKAGQALNQIAYSANSAPYRERLYLGKYLHWLNKLSSVVMLLSAVVPRGESRLGVRKPSSISQGHAELTANKINPISFRLTPDELAQFETLIRQAGCSLSNFFREMILNNSPVFREFTGLRKRLVFIVNKAGNNITQLAYVANTAFQRGLIDDSVYLKWLDILIAVEELLLLGIDYAD